MTAQICVQMSVVSDVVPPPPPPPLWEQQVLQPILPCFGGIYSLFYSGEENCLLIWREERWLSAQ